MTTPEETIDPKPHEEEEEEEEGDLFEQGEKPWDEGGPSDCGYADTVHSTIMSVGESVHSVVGEPNSQVSQAQTAVGNWFQELSYAVRDMFRGDKEMQDDASAAIKELIDAGSESFAMKDEKKESIE